MGGVKYNDLKKEYNFKNKDLEPLPVQNKHLDKNLEVHYLGYYLKWTPQECYYYAVKNCGFRPRPFRTKEHTASITVLMIKLMIFIISPLL